MTFDVGVRHGVSSWLKIRATNRKNLTRKSFGFACIASCKTKTDL